MTNDNMLSFIGNTPDSIMLSIAKRIKERRLEMDWTQKLLASKAGVPIATYRRFEIKGEISLRGLIMVAIALGFEDDFNSLFSMKSYQSIDELIKSTGSKQRKRGGKNE